MTITTAKLPGKILRLTPLALAALLLSAECRADWKFTPTIGLRETYTDNVALQRDEIAENQFISEAIPAFSLTGNTSRLKVSANAAWHAFAYRDQHSPNLHDSERSYQANAQAKLIDELLYVDAGATESRQAVSAFGPTSNSNPFATVNRTEISTWRISPYLQHRFGSTAAMTLRFTRDSVDAGANNAFGSSVASTTSANLVSGSSFRDIGWDLSYNHQDLSNRLAGESMSENSTANLRWSVVRRLALTAGAGYDKYEYPSLEERTSGPSWSAGFIWTPSLRTSVRASFGHRYFGKTGALAASHRSRHSVWTLDYNDVITTTRSQLTLPSTIDTADLLDRLFSSSISDPVLRQQAVRSYMESAGLPASLAESVNYLSNRYIRAKRLQGAVAFRGARSGLVLSVFRDERNALSLQQSDSALLGSALSSLNDNTRQRGASIDVDYALSPRTSASASLSASRVQSLTTGIVNNNHEARLSMTRRFDRKTRGILEVRRVRGGLGLASNDVYHENAIVATLSVQY
jgi:uncharacterized protein (PEP-CTERM system associated)